MSIPSTNVNICILGCVSTGKSVLLNALLEENFSEYSRLRTTMTPCVFIETNKTQRTNFKEINHVIKEANKKLYSQEETKTEDYPELIFKISKLNLHLSRKLNIYDTPGLNDSQTRHIYYDYLKKNFEKFNIILLVIDINSAVNTSDEMDILKFIASQEHKVKTIVIINKADNMELTNGMPRIVEEEELRMFNQAKKCIEHEIKDNLVEIIPMCSKRAYIYRMIKADKLNDILTNEIIHEIGIDEIGRRFLRMNKDAQEQKVKEIISNRKFVEEMIRLSGFYNLKTCLTKLIQETGTDLIYRNILRDYHKLPIIQITEEQNNLDVLTEYHDILEQIKDSVSSEKHNTLIETIKFEINKKIGKVINKIPTVKRVCTFYDNISMKLSHSFLEFSTDYPEYIINHVFSLISNEFKSIININTIIFTMCNLIRINKINIVEQLTSLIDTLIQYKLSTNTYTIQLTGIENNVLFSFLDELKKYRLPNFVPFIRLLLVNRRFMPENIEELYLLYDKYNEKTIKLVIQNIMTNKNINYETVIYGFNEEKLNTDNYKLDYYYLKNMNYKH
jgi:small GTP-binding protein